ncbi:MAG: 30S ribosomal protein S16 [Candidatus Shapirobacteria bacterium]|jgi:small subunit ribosomal protein S16
MLKIKLKPNGKVHQRSFRIIVAPDRSKVNGNFVDDLGFYTPNTKTLQIDQEKLAKWVKNGAQITEGVDKLLNPDKYPRKKKNKVVEKTEKAVETKAEEKIVETKTEETNQNPSVAEATSPLDKEDTEKQEVAEVKTETEESK